MCGNMEYGKLGLGEGWSQGVILTFTVIPNLRGIKYMACGPGHMIAISDVCQDSQDKRGNVFAWGMNSRG